MQYRRFGRTGWQVSEIAFGAWQLGGDWGAVDDDASIRTLHHAFDRGVNLVDTAHIYGNGHSEEVIGRALRQWSGHKIYVATKAQPVEWPAPDDEAPQMRGRYPAWYLRKMVDSALRRLQVDRIDLFQLHSWMASGLYELDWLETLNALRVEGKIDQIGVSIRDYRPADGVDLARLGVVGGALGRAYLCQLCARFCSRAAFPRRSLCGNAGKGAVAESALRAILSDIGRGGDALCAVLPRAVLRHSGHAEPRTGGYECDLQRWRAVSGRVEGGAGGPCMAPQLLPVGCQ